MAVALKDNGSVVTGHKCSRVIDRLRLRGHCSTAINYVYTLACVGWGREEEEQEQDEKIKRNRQKE